MLHEVQDVPQSRVLGALRYPRPPGRRELAFKAVQKMVDDQALALTDG